MKNQIQKTYKISKHISFREATFSQTAIKNGIINNPNEEEIENMIMVSEKCFEPLRELYGKPIMINSFYRCRGLNKLVGGAENSHHIKGMAIDMSSGSLEDNEIIFNWCKNNLEFTQLINEYGGEWIHISYDPNDIRNQILIT